MRFFLSLNESEQELFLSEFSADEIDAFIAQLQSAPEQQLAIDGDYASERSAKSAAVINAKTAAAQEVGPLPAPRDPERRKRASENNLLFAETYFAPTFYLDWAPYQREMMDRFQAVILDGGKEAHAVRRGGLKSTCARVSTIWAVVNGHRRFPVLTGATDDKATEHRQNFFDMLVSSPTLLEDYPELLPLLLKWKQPKKSFRLDGQILTLSHKDDRGRIVFPDIPSAASCQAHIAPYSINSTDVSGLAFVNKAGVTVRPDLIVYDDVQTPQTAKSPSQTDTLETRITKTFGGLAGLGQQMAQIMVCTVREHDDLTMRFINRKRHADWYGKRYPSLIKLPKRMDLWDQYAALLGQGATPAEGKALAQAFYLRHQDAMEIDAVVAWELDKQSDEITALQSLMTIRALDPEFFAKEIQQEGQAPANSTSVKLDSQSLLQRVSNMERGQVSDLASYLTCYIDSSDQVLWWMVCAWAKDFSGWVVDYGTWPDQGRPVFYKSDLARKINELLPGASWEEAFVLAHNQLEEMLFARYPELDLVLKDWSDGQHKPRIESQVQASANRHRLRPSKQASPKPGRKPVHLWGNDRKDRQNNQHWVEKRSETPVNVMYDANYWKTHTARRLLTTVGAPSSLVLPGTEPNANRLLVEHLTAEQPKAVTYDGANGTVWELMPGRDNDWFDTLVGCTAAASMVGCVLAGESNVGSVKQRRVFSIPGAAR